MTINRLAVFPAVLLLSACQMQPPAAALEAQSGMELYERLCASCHGVSAKGDGPVAPLIKTNVPDLTRIAHRDGGVFPAEDVRRTIDGRFERPAHGPRDMPVWGWQFYDTSNSDDAAERAQVDSMIGRLVDYLRSIQGE